MMDAAGAPFLLIDPVHDVAYPVAAGAFETLSAPRSRVMARHATALFLTPTGEVLHLTDVTPHTPGPMTMLKLRLGQAVPARYGTERIEMPLADVKTMLLDCATYMRSGNRPARDWWLTTAPLEDVRAIITAPGSFSALHQAIPIAPSDIQETLK